jgi:hypothetical protein
MKVRVSMEGGWVGWVGWEEVCMHGCRAYQSSFLVRLLHWKDINTCHHDRRDVSILANESHAGRHVYPGSCDASRHRCIHDCVVSYFGIVLFNLVVDAV